MTYKIDFGIWGGIFAVPTAVADRELKFCTGEQLKVLLLALRDAPDAVDVAYIGRRLGMPPSEVCDCLDYWQSRHLFEKREEAAEEPAAPVGKEPPRRLTIAPATAEAPQKLPETAEQEAGVTVRHSRAKLTPSQINALSQADPLIPSLLEELQNRLARPLSPGEQETIVYLYTYLQLKPEYLLLVTEYCRSKNKANMRYIEKTVLEWVDKGIDTHDRAEAYLQELDRRESNEGLIQTMFGIQGRELSSREKDFIETWFQTYHFSEEMIRLAYERTVDNTGKISFPYLNKILSQWFEKGIHTPADAEQEMGTRKAVGNTASQATYDLDEIQRIMELNSSQ